MTNKSVMLGTISVRDLHGPWMDFMQKLQTEESQVWFDGFKRFLRKENPWPLTACIIDCDAQPYLPDGWSVEEHQKGGAFKWDKENQKDALYLSKDQVGASYTGGDKLRKELAGKPVLNANVLDYLLENPHLTPEEWKYKNVFFWGTVYRRRRGILYVRCLSWRDGRWDWGFCWLGSVWICDHPAAMRA